MAIGSTDFSLSIVSCVIVDEEHDKVLLEHEDESYTGPYSTVQTLGDELLHLKDTGGWVESIAFSPDAAALVYAVHNGTLGSVLINENQEAKPVSGYLTLPNLPVKTLLFVAPGQIVAAGYDGRPFLVTLEADGQLKFSVVCEKLLSQVTTVKQTNV